MELSDIQHARTRIQIEFIEMPALRLRRDQVSRLLNLLARPCDVALASLVDSGFLRRTADGAFVRTTAVPTVATWPRRASSLESLGA